MLLRKARKVKNHKSMFVRIFSSQSDGRAGCAVNELGSPVTLYGVIAAIFVRPGWFLGGGTEYALNMDWIPIHGLFWRTEYRYAS